MHERAVNCIVQYLQGTCDKELTFKPDPKAGIECFVDTNFSGNWDAGEPENPTSVLSRTDYVIMYEKCPLVWSSKLQTEITLSMTKAEYIALSQLLWEVIPLMGLIKEIHGNFKVVQDIPKINCTVFKDNNSCIMLAKAPRMNPRTKYIAFNIINFRSTLQMD